MSPFRSQAGAEAVIEKVVTATDAEKTAGVFVTVNSKDRTDGVPVTMATYRVGYCLKPPARPHGGVEVTTTFVASDLAGISGRFGNAEATEPTGPAQWLRQRPRYPTGEPA